MNKENYIYLPLNETDNHGLEVTEYSAFTSEDMARKFCDMKSLVFTKVEVNPCEFMKFQKKIEEYLNNGYLLYCAHFYENAPYNVGISNDVFSNYYYLMEEDINFFDKLSNSLEKFSEIYSTNNYLQIPFIATASTRDSIMKKIRKYLNKKIFQNKSTSNTPNVSNNKKTPMQMLNELIKKYPELKKVMY